MHKSNTRTDPTPLRMEVADGVRAFIAYRRTTQDAVAKEIGRSQQWMSRRLNYELPFTVEDLVAIAAHLDTTLFSLLHGLEPEADEKAMDRRSQDKRTSGRTPADGDLLVLVDSVHESAPDLIAA